jgi:hypothetical protein
MKLRSSLVELIWLWVVIELQNRLILALSISKERNRFDVEPHISGLVEVQECNQYR